MKIINKFLNLFNLSLVKKDKLLNLTYDYCASSEFYNFYEIDNLY